MQSHCHLHHGKDLGTSYVEADPTGRYARFDQVLGKGAVKTVYKAVDEQLGMEVAWNQCHLNHFLITSDELQRLYSEVHLLSTLHHDSIMKFHASWIDTHNTTFNFITEMFTSGNLREYRKKFRRIDMYVIKSWARQILHGLVYLHGHDPPIIHRDLKCDNIFVNGHLRQVKIGDFGLAAILRGCQSAHSIIGTPEFMAPEFYEEDYNELVDIYSFGMCVLEMLTAEFPYSECTNSAQIYKKVTSGKLPRAFYQIKDTEAQRFVGKCLGTASKRLSAKEMLMDPFLSSSDGELLLTSKIGIQNPFLNDLQLEKLKLGNKRMRTKMAITGKLNPEDDTIFLKVQISGENDSSRNIYFPFDVLSDTPMAVANEMVKELEIIDWDPQEIANMIDEEISILVPEWKKWEVSHPERENDFFHQLEGNNNGPPWSSSSSQASVSASEVRTSHRAGEMHHHHDDFHHNFYADDFHHNISSIQSEGFSASDLITPSNHEHGPSRTRSGSQSYNLNSGHANDQTKTIVEEGMVSRSNPTTHFRNTGQMEKRKLTRNKSVVDSRSHELHNSLVAEVNRRRLFKTVGAVENIGFKSPYT